LGLLILAFWCTPRLRSPVVLTALVACAFRLPKRGTGFGLPAAHSRSLFWSLTLGLLVTCVFAVVRHVFVTFAPLDRTSIPRVRRSHALLPRALPLSHARISIVPCVACLVEKPRSSTRVARLWMRWFVLRLMISVFVFKEGRLYALDSALALFAGFGSVRIAFCCVDSPSVPRVAGFTTVFFLPLRTLHTIIPLSFTTVLLCALRCSPFIFRLLSFALLDVLRFVCCVCATLYVYLSVCAVLRFNAVDSAFAFAAFVCLDRFFTFSFLYA